jgi:type II secretory pathway pseudopilin PulG
MIPSALHFNSPISLVRNRRSGFTLVEILVVVALMIIVIGLMSPALHQIGKSRSLANTGNHMVDLIANARQNSMTKNCLTVLIISTGANQWNSCILYELRPRADGSAPVSQDWKPISKWETLPSEITIDDTTLVDQTASATLPASLPVIQYGKSTIAEYHFVTFMPRGTLYPKTLPSDGNPSLRLVQGTRSGQTVLYTSTKKDGTVANFYKITVLTATGGTKIERS